MVASTLLNPFTAMFWPTVVHSSLKPHLLSDHLDFKSLEKDKALGR